MFDFGTKTERLWNKNGTKTERLRNENGTKTEHTTKNMCYNLYSQNLTYLKTHFPLKKSL